MEKAARLLTVKKTQLEMMEARKLPITPEELPVLKMNPQKTDDLRRFIEIYQNPPPFITAVGKKGEVYEFRQHLSRYYVAENGDTTLVIYIQRGDVNKQRIGVAALRDVTPVARSLPNLKNIVMISEVVFGHKTSLELQGMTEWFKQIILDESLMYNIIKHQLVPRHELLSEQEGKDFLERNRLKPHQLPLLKFVDRISLLAQKDRTRATDPVVEFYGLRPGQIVRVYRENRIRRTLVKKTLGYRIVSV